MSRAVVQRIAWGSCGVAVILSGAQAWIDYRFLSVDLPYHSAGDVRFDALGLVFFAVNGAVGALIVTRQPRNAVGWLFLSYPLLGVLGNLANSYALYGTYVAPGAFSGTALAYRMSQIFSSLTFVTVPFVMLVFPDGRFLSARWRKIGLAIVLPLPISVLLQLVEPVTDDPNMPAALALPGWDGVIAALAMLQVIFGVTAFGLGAISAGIRYRRSRGIERLQMKWMVYASGVVLVSLLTLATGAFLPFLLALELLPIAAGIAILRYRLYDIDVLIKRTVVYGSTTAAIAVTFWVGILALQDLLAPLTSGSEVAVAASTLVSVALFQPVRRWVQDVVDRRFDRAHYDAARILDVFAEGLPDDVDLDALRTHLMTAVDRTMVPSHASLWLREIAR